MTYDHQKFSQIASGLKNIVFAIAVVAGGWWIYSMFANLAFEKEFERRLQPSLGFALAFQSTETQSGGEHRVLLQLDIRNEGSSNLNIDLSKPLLQVAKIKTNGVGANFAVEAGPWPLSAFSIAASKLEPEGARYLRPGISRHIAFATIVPGAGTYLIQVDLPYVPIAGNENAAGSQESRVIARDQWVVEIPNAEWHTVGGFEAVRRVRR